MCHSPEKDPGGHQGVFFSHRHGRVPIRLRQRVMSLLRRGLVEHRGRSPSVGGQRAAWPPARLGGCGRGRLGEEHPCLHTVTCKSPRPPPPRHPGRPPPRRQLLLRSEVTSCLLRLAVTQPGGPLEQVDKPQRQRGQGWGGGTSPCPTPAAPEIRQLSTPKMSQVQ